MSNLPENTTVLHVMSGNAWQGGLASVVAEVARNSGDGVRHLVWLHKNVDVKTDHGLTIVRAGVIKKHHVVPFWDIFVAIVESFALLKYMSRHNVSILHAHTRIGIMSACAAGKIKGVTVVAHVHYLARYRWFYRWLWSISRVSLVFNSSKTCRHYGFSPDDYPVVHPSIEWPAVAAGGVQNCVRLIFAGAYIRAKKIHLIIDAFDEARRYYPKLKLILFGDTADPLDPMYSRQIKVRASETEGIEVRSWTASWLKEMQAGDIYMQLSQEEAFGISLLQAYAAGLPLVVGSGTFIDDLPSPLNCRGIYRVAETGSGAAAAVGEAFRDHNRIEDLHAERLQAKGCFSADHARDKLRLVYQTIRAGSGRGNP